jgi:hypothetical protein
MAVYNIEQIPFGTTTKGVLKLFSDQEATQPKMTFWEMFGKPPGITDYSNKSTVSIEIERYGQRKAVDVLRYGTGNLNIMGRSTEKIYKPPMYDEYTRLDAEELNQRMPGELPTDPTGNQTARMIFNLTKAMLEIRKKILRAMEFMSVEALWNGVITLINTESLDFKRKSTHNITPINDWTDQTNGDPIADIAAGIYVIVTDGKISSKVIHAVMDLNAFNLFQGHTKVQNYLDKRLIEPGLIQPSIQADSGLAYCGHVIVDGRRVEIYTYPEYYEDDAGVYQPYIPADTVLLKGDNIRLDKAFGAIGIRDFTQDISVLGMRMPSIVQADFVPYFLEDGISHVMAGVKSSPVVIPTQIDGFAVLNVGP